jgi:hypothetical protein
MHAELRWFAFHTLQRRSPQPGDRSRYLPGAVMWFDCRCGNTIKDNTDGLRQKGHLTPDQDLYSVWDGMDEQVIDRVASGELALNDAYVLSRRLMSLPTRMMYQCFECGRLYIDGPDGELNCFLPESDKIDKGILRSRNSK